MGLCVVYTCVVLSSQFHCMCLRQHRVFLTLMYIAEAFISGLVYDASVHMSHCTYRTHIAYSEEVCAV